MERKSLFKIVLFVMLAIVQTACENAKYSSIGNMVYINEAASHKTGTVSMLNETNRTSLTIRLAHAMDQDVKVALAIDGVSLDRYNSLNGTNYKLTKEEYVSFPKEVTIKAGSVSAPPIDVDVQDFETEGAQYALPLSIHSADGGVSIAETSSKFILILARPLKQLVPQFSPRNYSMKALPTENWGLSLTNYTLEWWCKMSAFSINNQAVFTSGSGSTELYIRFGDLTYGRNYAFLQVKAMGSQFDSGDPNNGHALEPNKWYHFAVTYDASLGATQLYQNGVSVGKLTTEEGKPMIIDQLQLISSDMWSDKCDLCQVRLWNVTRTSDQIEKGMYSEVDYKDKNLILYLPMNEGSGTTELHDVTGNGHDVTTIPNATSVPWNSYTFSK